jgi:membrane-bound metal-dependent hydrolase YbcI (DUF457 family)
MMARSHALIGAAGWLAAAPSVASVTGHYLDGPTLAAGTLICAGAALLPDLDHPSGLMADTLGPVTHLLARRVARVAGGHRQATHSLLLGLAAGAGTWALVRWVPGWLALALAAFLAAMAVRAVEGLRWQVIATVAGLVTWAASTVAPGMVGQLPAAVMAGCWLHVLADLLTPEGVPPFWPWRWRVALPIVDHTGGRGETYLLGPVLGLLVLGLAWVRLTAVG